jgi:hypothetical protein
MADDAVVHIGENSREGVAYKLMFLIRQTDHTNAPKDKKGVLDLFAECLDAASGHRTYPKPPKP